jgi:hypothetical protein
MIWRVVDEKIVESLLQFSVSSIQNNVFVFLQYRNLRYEFAYFLLGLVDLVQEKLISAG